MPFKSEAQKRYLYAKHPEIAERWSDEEKSKTTPPSSTDTPSRVTPASQSPSANKPATPPPSGGMSPAKLDWLDANAGKSAEHSNRRSAYQRRLDRIKKNASS